MPATRLISAMVATWNNVATVFTAIKMDVTDTASAAGSKLMDLLIGGVSLFQVVKTSGAGAAGAMIILGTGTPKFELTGRGTDAFDGACPVFRAATTNTPTALDIMPNGTGGVGGAKAWIDVCLNDISPAGSAHYSTLYLGIQSDKCVVGSHTSNSGPYTEYLPLYLGGKTILFSSGAFGPGAITAFAQVDELGFRVLNSGNVSNWIYNNQYRNVAGLRFGWVASATDATQSIDTAIGRNAAGVVEVNNGTAGTLRDIKVRQAVQSPQASVSPAANGEMVVEATSNTTLTFKLKGSDGTVRSATLTLA